MIVPEMGAVIVHPRGQGQGYDFVARVPLDAWASLPDWEATLRPKHQVVLLAAWCFF